MYSAITLRRQLERAATENNIRLRYSLKNVRVNGVLKGCSGHVVDSETGICVYMTTDVGSYKPLSDKAMYRLAKNERDYSSNSLKSGYNRWTKTGSLPYCVIDLIKNERKKANGDAAFSCGA